MALTHDVTQLKDQGNPRISQLNINDHTYEIWDDTARLAISEISTNLDTLTSDSGGKFNEVIPKVNQIYKELTDYANSAEDGLADSIIDSLFNKFTGDKANQAVVSDKIGTTTVGSATRPVYINAGVPTQVAYTAASGGPTKNESPAHGAGFTVPQVSQAAGGQVTVTNRTITLPAATTWLTLTGKPSTFAPIIGTTADTAAAGNHTHTASLAQDTTTTTGIVELSSGNNYKLIAGGNSVIFKMPAAITWSTLSDKPTLATVATSGSYNDLTNKPTLLTLGTTSSTAAKGDHTHTTTLKTSTGTSAITLTSAGRYQLTAGGNSVIFTMPTAPTWSTLDGKPTLATVATSGSYNDLTNKPTIPTVNNASLTISGQSGSKAFTANASSNVTTTVSLYEKTAPIESNNWTLELGIKIA